MPLAPSKYYHFDQTWPTGEPVVIMTPMRVWGPLVIGGLVSLIGGLLLLMEVIFLG